MQVGMSKTAECHSVVVRALHSTLLSVFVVTQPCCCRYELLMQAFGGEGFAVNSRQQLLVACRQAFAARQPALINVAINPLAGVESGTPAILCMLRATLGILNLEA